jgi:hypothetical protein
MVYNFLAVQIIGQFDLMIYASVGDQTLKKLIGEEVGDKLLIVRHTTSKRCKKNVMTEICDEKGRLRLMRVFFKDRSCTNKLIFIFYKGYRLIYIQVYFYLIPIVLLLLSFFIPAKYGD